MTDDVAIRRKAELDEIVERLAMIGIDIETERCDPVAIRDTANMMNRVADLIEYP